MLHAEIHIQVGLDAIIVEQSIVDVEQEDEIVHHASVSAAGFGFHQGPSPPTSASTHCAADGRPVRSCRRNHG
jgi:hypothetical protein